jgi:hypothetical protein
MSSGVLDYIKTIGFAFMRTSPGFTQIPLKPPFSFYP